MRGHCRFPARPLHDETKRHETQEDRPKQREDFDEATMVAWRCTMPAIAA
jgi:hypothetical protein